MPPWRDWYHCMGNTYGTWLRGDARGWRARHHREHVDGDYKHPPPRGTYDQLLLRSKQLMPRPAVHLPPDLRPIVLKSIIETLGALEIQVIAASLDDHHLHLLARFPDHNPRIPLGIAKHHATKSLKERGLDAKLNLNLGEGLWAKRTKCQPIRDRDHQVNVFRYILSHAKHGAAIWTLRGLGRACPAV